MAVADRVRGVQATLQGLRNPIATGAAIHQKGFDQLSRSLDSVGQIQAETGRQRQAAISQLSSDVSEGLAPLQERARERRAHENWMQRAKFEAREQAARDLRMFNQSERAAGAAARRAETAAVSAAGRAETAADAASVRRMNETTHAAGIVPEAAKFTAAADALKQEKALAHAAAEGAAERLNRLEAISLQGDQAFDLAAYQESQANYRQAQTIMAEAAQLERSGELQAAREKVAQAHQLIMQGNELADRAAGRKLDADLAREQMDLQKFIAEGGWSNAELMQQRGIDADSAARAEQIEAELTSAELQRVFQGEQAALDRALEQGRIDQQDAQFFADLAERIAGRVQAGEIAREQMDLQKFIAEGGWSNAELMQQRGIDADSAARAEQIEAELTRAELQRVFQGEQAALDRALEQGRIDQQDAQFFADLAERIAGRVQAGEIAREQMDLQKFIAEGGWSNAELMQQRGIDADSAARAEQIEAELTSAELQRVFQGEQAALDRALEQGRIDQQDAQFFADLAERIAGRVQAGEIAREQMDLQKFIAEGGWSNAELMQQRGIDADSAARAEQIEAELTRAELQRVFQGEQAALDRALEQGRIDQQDAQFFADLAERIAGRVQAGEIAREQMDLQKFIAEGGWSNAELMQQRGIDADSAARAEQIAAQLTSAELQRVFQGEQAALDRALEQGSLDQQDAQFFADLAERIAGRVQAGEIAREQMDLQKFIAEGGWSNAELMQQRGIDADSAARAEQIEAELTRAELQRVFQGEQAALDRALEQGRIDQQDAQFFADLAERIAGRVQAGEIAREQMDLQKFIAEGGWSNAELMQQRGIDADSAARAEQIEAELTSAELQRVFQGEQAALDRALEQGRIDQQDAQFFADLAERIAGRVQAGEIAREQMDLQKFIAEGGWSNAELMQQRGIDADSAARAEQIAAQLTSAELQRVFQGEQAALDRALEQGSLDQQDAQFFADLAERIAGRVQAGEEFDATMVFKREQLAAMTQDANAKGLDAISAGISLRDQILTDSGFFARDPVSQQLTFTGDPLQWEKAKPQIISAFREAMKSGNYSDADINAADNFLELIGPEPVTMGDGLAGLVEQAQASGAIPADASMLDVAAALIDDGKARLADDGTVVRSGPRKDERWLKQVGVAAEDDSDDGWLKRWFKNAVGVGKEYAAAYAKAKAGQ